MYSVPFQWESEPSDNDRNGKEQNIGVYAAEILKRRHEFKNLYTFMNKRAVLYLT